MRVKLEEKKDEMHIDDVDISIHIIVGKINGDWVFIKREMWSSPVLMGLLLKEGFTLSNMYNKQAISIKQFAAVHNLEEMHVFETMKEACKFLITVL